MDLHELSQYQAQAAQQDAPIHSGVVSRISSAGTFVKIPTLSTTAEFGPAKTISVGTLAEGDSCLVVFDDRNDPWIVNQGTKWPIVPTVTSLPVSPVNGQEVYYQNAAMATAGVRWHLVYNAASANASKWEFAGGNELYAEALANVSSGVVANASWFSADVNDPKITVPLAGDYEVQHSAFIVSPANATVGIGVKVGATEPVVNGNAMLTQEPAASGYGGMHQRRRLLAVAASTVLQQRYWGNPGASPNYTVGGRVMAVLPVRVG